VDDPLLVRVLDAVADLVEQPQTLVGVETVLVAVPRDRNALDQLHREVRSALLRRAGVEDVGDIGVIHEGEGLALTLESCDDLPAVHTGLDELERYPAADGFFLERLVDLTHPALAQSLNDPIGSDPIGKSRVGKRGEGDPVVPHRGPPGRSTAVRTVLPTARRIQRG
jgi:hypothetical protein